MCDECNTQQVGNDARVNKQSTFRDRLESQRNSLSRQLAQVETALHLLYSNPDAEKIHETLNRAGIF
jgi:hypothetical protein